MPLQSMALRSSGSSEVEVAGRRGSVVSVSWVRWDAEGQGKGVRRKMSRGILAADGNLCVASPVESHRESAAALGGLAEAGVQAEESLGHARGGAAPSATA